MKSTLASKSPQPPQPLKFPLLAICIGSDRAQGYVVLFIAPSVGVVINKDKATDKHTYHVGYYSSSWISVDTSKVWRILGPEEQLTLSNE